MSPTILILLLPHLCTAISVQIPGGTPSESHRVPQSHDMRSYSYAATDFSTANGTHIKTITVIKNGAVPHQHDLQPIYEDLDENTWSVSRGESTLGVRTSQYVPYELHPLGAPNRTSLLPSRRAFFSVSPDASTEASHDVLKVQNDIHRAPVLSTKSQVFPPILTTQKSPHSRTSRYRSHTNSTRSRSRDRQQRGKRLFLEEFSDFQSFKRATEKSVALVRESEVTSTQVVEDTPETTEDSTASEPPETTSEALLIASRVRAYRASGNRRI